MFRPRSVQQLTVRGSFTSTLAATQNGGAPLRSADSSADYTKLELLPQSTLLPDSGTPPRSPYDNDKRKLAPGGAVAARLRRASQQHAAALLQLLLLLLVASLWLLHAHSAYKASQPRHLIVLDAGSTGTRVHVFAYAPDAGSSYAALALPEPKLKVEPGLSSFADDAAGAAASLQPLLEFAARHVPAAQWRATPVYLMATAGLRLLPRAAVDAILRECRDALAASAFLFEHQWADVISGTNEGLYAWVAANYAAGHLQAAAEDAAHGRKELHQGPPPFKALIELGGASAQVTFMPQGGQQHHQHTRGKQQHRSKHSVRLKLPGVSHHSLWTHSFLGFGFDVVQSKVDTLIKQAGGRPSSSVAQDRQQQQDGSTAAVPAQAAADAPGSGVLLDPCLPAGYAADDGRVGSGVWAQCQVLVAQAMDPASCQPGNQHTPCPELPTDMPKLAGELLAIENFAYTARALSVPAVASLGEFAAAARAFCSRPWPQTLQAHSHEPEQQQHYLWRYCFGSAFAWTLLHQVLQIGEGQRLHFTNALTRADGAELGLDWALGAAVLQLSNNSAAEGAQLRRHARHQRLLLAAAVLCSGVLAAGLALTVAGVLQRHSHHAVPIKLAPHVPWLTVELPQPSAAGGGGGVEAAASGGSSDWGRVMSASSWAASSPATSAGPSPATTYHVR